MKVQRSSFPSFDEVTIHIQQWIPQGAIAKETPAVLFQPGNRCTVDDYRWLLEPLCQAGYLVYGIYPRGYGSGTPGQNDRGGPVQQQDLRLALQHLLDDPLVDRQRIACVGHSNGGHMVQRLAAEAPIKCAVAMSQVSDWALFVGASKDYLPDYYRQVTSEFGGPPEENPKPYLERSCLHLADKIQVPVLAITGEDDTITPPHLSRLMYDALRKSGNQGAELIIIPGAGHFFEVYAFDGYLTDQVATEVVRWLKKTL